MVRERTISGAPGWYVYRDGAWSSSLTGDWWDDPGLPRVVVSGDGWVREANATARVCSGSTTMLSRRTTSPIFVVPGTLDDAVNLFRIIASGKILDATILVRPDLG